MNQTKHAASVPVHSSPTDMEQLADSLSQLADQLHSRILRAIRNNHLSDSSGSSATVASGQVELAITLEDAQALLQDEMMLRQRANRLYAGAAIETGSALALARGEVIALAHAASVKIHRLNTLKELIELSTHLLALANAALAAKPEQFISAAERIRQDVLALHKETLTALP